MPRIRLFNRKQRHSGNRYTAQRSSISPEQQTNQSEPANIAQMSPVLSASKRKIKLRDISSDSDDVCVFVNLNILSNLIMNNVKCKYCDCTNCVEICEDSNGRRGFASKLSLRCRHCQESNSCMTSKFIQGKKVFEVNLRLAYAMRCIGKGHRGATTFAALMNLPAPPAKFCRYNNIILEALKDVSEDSMKKAAEESISANDGCKDIVAAFDGTWQKRGHSSLNGVVSATSFDTGKVLDVEILTKYCHGCVHGSPFHKCARNYTGTSGGMEVSGAVNIFLRSEETRGVRYTKYLGDGDTKAFLKVKETAPYGDSVNIEKLECVGHVQKRLGTRLRKLRQDLSGKKLSDGKGIKGKGRLTDGEIDKLQTYYGMAIRANAGDLKKMKEAVWATYFHKLSTEENPVHALCPKGLDSWCGYQRQISGGDVYQHKHSLPEAVMDVIKPIYRDLANETLLSKCLHGCTQNPNESFNQSIWERLPKTVFVGGKTLQIGVLDAIICFNDGCQARNSVFTRMGIKPGNNCSSALLLFDRERIMKSERDLMQISKAARISKRVNKKRKQDEESEEAKDYDPGAF